MSKATSNPTSDMAQGQGREQRLQEEDSMSSPIAPTSVLAATPAVPGGGLPKPQPPASAATVGPAVSVDTLPGSPPQEVLDQMAGAAHTYEALQSQGRELRFAREEHSGRIRIEVRDRQGNVLRTLSPAQALEVAAGAPLD